MQGGRCVTLQSCHITIYLENLQPVSFSVSLSIEESISVFLLATKAGSNRCKLPLEVTEEEEAIEEVTEEVTGQLLLKRLTQMQQ